jgi:hypothetical protein
MKAKLLFDCVACGHMVFPYNRRVSWLAVACFKVVVQGTVRGRVGHTCHATVPQLVCNQQVIERSVHRSERQLGVLVVLRSGQLINHDEELSNGPAVVGGRLNQVTLHFRSFLREKGDTMAAA